MQKITTQQQRNISGGAHTWGGLPQYANVKSTAKTIQWSFQWPFGHVYHGTWGNRVNQGGGIGNYSTYGYKQTCYCY